MRIFPGKVAQLQQQLAALQRALAARGELQATLLEHPLGATADLLIQGRSEGVSAGGSRLPDEVLAILLSRMEETMREWKQQFDGYVQEQLTLLQAAPLPRALPGATKATASRAERTAPARPGRSGPGGAQHAPAEDRAPGQPWTEAQLFEEGWPGGKVSKRRMCLAHNVPETTVTRAIAAGLLTVTDEEAPL